jgi:ubiquinone/menaquinone biosynthesis C-methylase UbiE
MPKEERYVIQGGRRGYDRLLLLARDRWSDTLALFQRAGLSPGMRCLDLGCGGGEVTLEMAKLVTPGGTVIGVDMDAVKLGLARRAASDRELGNVDFRQMNAGDWNEPDAYDAVFSRFLLQHLSRPIDLLRRMWAGVRRGGVLMVEDADHDGRSCDPPNDGFDFLRRNYVRVLEQNGGDPAIGRKLRRYFLESGIPDPQLSMVQSVRVEGELKTLPQLTLETTSDAIVAAGLASPPEVAAALASLAKFVRDPETLVTGPRIFQLWARRQGAGAEPRPRRA